MTDEAMSPLRRRMIEDMTIRKLSAEDPRRHIRTIKNFAAFLGRSPDTASQEEVRRSTLASFVNYTSKPLERSWFVLSGKLGQTVTPAT